MEAAAEIVRISIDRSNKYRRKNPSFGWMMRRADYNVYSPGEEGWRVGGLREGGGGKLKLICVN